MARKKSFLAIDKETNIILAYSETYEGFLFAVMRYMTANGKRNSKMWILANGEQSIMNVCLAITAKDCMEMQFHPLN